MQEHTAAPVDEEGTAAFINCQQQASVWAEAQCPYL